MASTNLNVVRLLGALGEQFGPALLRRLCGPRWNPDGDKPADHMTGGALIDFYENRITSNYQHGSGGSERSASQGQAARGNGTFN